MWVYIFGDLGLLGALAPYIPTSAPQLPPAVYELVLNYLRFNDHAGLLETLRTWPVDIYTIRYDHGGGLLGGHRFRSAEASGM